MSTPLQHDAGESTTDSRGEARGSGKTGFAAVLGNRAFLSIWTAQILSQTAQNSLWYALIIMVANLTGQTPAGIGFTIILVQLPTVLFSSVSGVLVDRVSKHAILVGTNVIRVAGVLGYLAFNSNIGALYLITFLVAVVSQPFAPAEGSALPMLVDGEALITANSLFQMTFMASQALGFAVSPIAIGLFGMQHTLVVLAALFAFSAVVLIPLPSVTRRRLPKEDLPITALAKRTWHDLVEVTEFVLHDPPLAIALLQIALAPTLLLVLAEVGPDYLRHGLGIGETSTSLFFLLAPAGAGLAAGMVILGQWGYRLRKDRLVLVALIALGITVIGLASVPTIGQFWVSLRGAGLAIPQGVTLTFTMVPIAALMGIEVAFINAPVQTIVQQRAAPELRGRVLALQQTLTAAIAIPPLVLIGGVAAVVGTPATLALMGLIIVCVGLVIVYYA
jgi:hypothetical protein